MELLGSYSHMKKGSLKSGATLSSMTNITLLLMTRDEAQSAGDALSLLVSFYTPPPLMRFSSQFPVGSVAGRNLAISISMYLIHPRFLC